LERTAMVGKSWCVIVFFTEYLSIRIRSTKASKNSDRDRLTETAWRICCFGEYPWQRPNWSCMWSNHCSFAAAEVSLSPSQTRLVIHWVILLSGKWVGFVC